MIRDCKIDPTAQILYPELVNLYHCTIGADTLVGPFVEIQAKVKIGSECKIESHSFICEGITIGNNVFVGHGVVFINDLYPKAIPDYNWLLKHTHIGDNVSIGSNATILPVNIGAGSMIGAGSVVTKDVPEGVIVKGNPACFIRKVL